MKGEENLDNKSTMKKYYKTKSIWFQIGKKKQSCSVVQFIALHCRAFAMLRYIFVEMSLLGFLECCLGVKRSGFPVSNIWQLFMYQKNSLSMNLFYFFLHHTTKPAGNRPFQCLIQPLAKSTVRLEKLLNPLCNQGGKISPKIAHCSTQKV